MKNNEIFYDLCKYFAPDLSNQIKKTKTGYATYPSIKECGKKLVADFVNGILEYMVDTVHYIGGSYEHEVVKTYYRIGKNESSGCLQLTKI